MLGFIKYGGRDPGAREEEVVAEGGDDMGTVVEAGEKPVDIEDEEEGGGWCPFLGADCLRRSEPVEGNIVCRSTRFCPGA